MKYIITGIVLLVWSFSLQAQRGFFCQADQFVMKQRYTNQESPIYNTYLFLQPGGNVRIRFQNGSGALHNKVLQIGKEWEKYANIKFIVSERNISDVRISFNETGLIKAAVGNIAFTYPQDENNCFIDTSLLKFPKVFRAMVLHVFGHILGLQHENEVPLKGRKWNSEELQKYAAEKNWTVNKLKNYIIDPYSVSVSNGIMVDRKSVMYYNPKQNWTNEKTNEINDSLSQQDKTIISLLYPLPRDTRAEMQMFSVDKMGSIRVEKHNDGLSFYPEFDITVKKAYKLQMGIFFYNNEGNNINNYDGKYSFDDFLATVRAAYLIPTGTYHLNNLKNNLGFYLPYSEIPANQREKQVKIVFKVFFTDGFNMEDQKEFASKPVDIMFP